MVIAPGPRRFLTAAPLHLVLLGLLVGVSGVPFEGLLWLFLVGFVGFTALGFAWHLFPSIFRRRLTGAPDGPAYWAVAEASVVLGLVGRSSLVPVSTGWAITLAGSGAWLLVLLAFVGTGLRSLRTPPPHTGPPERPADRVATLLFGSSWIFGIASALLWMASSVTPGPGFGFWLAGVHTYVLGQLALLIFGVSLRLIPRSAGTDAPAWVARSLAATGLTGAIGVPLGLLALAPREGALLLIAGLLEGTAAVLFVLQLFWLVTRARTPRRAHWVYLASGSCLLVGGSVGLWMISSGDYGLVKAHAWTNLLGFLGLMILGMWFSMVAPFQFVSHRWTLRALSTGAVLILASVAMALLNVESAVLGDLPGRWLFGGLLAALGVFWSVGSLPVLHWRVHHPSLD